MREWVGGGARARVRVRACGCARVCACACERAGVRALACVRCGNLFILAQSIVPFWFHLLPDPAILASIVFDTASSFGDKGSIETAEHSDPTGTANGVRPEANAISSPVTGPVRRKLPNAL